MNTTPALNEHQDTDFGTTGKTALVHKKDAEGSLTIDAFTGQVLVGQHDRPEWAEGLTVAQLAERHQFYTTRLGSLYTEEHKQPEVYAFEDLGWIGANALEEPFVNPETGQEEDFELFVVDASEEHRMEVLATVLGISGDIDREEGTIDNVLASVDIAADNMRSPKELVALEESQKQGFAEASGE